MQPIPQPHILDPDRLLDNARDDFTADHKARADLLDDALHETCAYGTQLWQCLDDTRQYLWRSLPSDPRDPGPHRISAAPTGPHDEAGWADWTATFARVASVLCGSHGDSGFGLDEAQRAAQLRRDAPNLLLEAERATAAQHRPADPPPSRRSSPPATASEPPVQRSSMLRSVGLAVVGVLALRGLLPRRSRR